MLSKREITDGRMASENFKEIRLRLRLTQEELSDLLRVSVRTVERWEQLPYVGKGVPGAVRFAMYFLLENYPPEYRDKAGGPRIKKEAGYNQHEKKRELYT